MRKDELYRIGDDEIELKEIANSYNGIELIAVCYENKDKSILRDLQTVYKYDYLYDTHLYEGLEECSGVLVVAS